MSCCDRPKHILRIEKIINNKITDEKEKKDIHTNAVYPNDSTSENVSRVTAPVLPYEKMTPLVIAIDENAILPDEINLTPKEPTLDVPPYQAIIPNAPSFRVPPNPLLPPEYREVLDYNSLQYANGFYRTQIGRYMRVDHMMGPNILESTIGFLVGVGINYILIQDPDTPNITVIDMYSIKLVKVFYGSVDFISSPAMQ